MNTCTVDGCRAAVSRAGHTLCKPHWLAQKAGKLTECVSCGTVLEASPTGCPRCKGKGASEEAGAEDDRLVSSTRLGGIFGITARRMNLVLAELGWIEKYTKGWKPTAQGKTLGAMAREQRQTGVPFVVWPKEIAANHALVTFMKELEGEGPDSAKPDATEAAPAADRPGSKGSRTAQDFRARFPTTMRAADGHMVRSRGEVLIDNFLYVQGIVHAYERRLPVEEDVLCDFYLPRGNVYIEYWGIEKNADYTERKAEKKAVYEKHRLKLIDLTNDHIAALDDELPRMLLKFGVDCT